MVGAMISSQTSIPPSMSKNRALLSKLFRYLERMPQWYAGMMYGRKFHRNKSMTVPSMPFPISCRDTQIHSVREVWFQSITGFGEAVPLPLPFINTFRLQILCPNHLPSSDFSKSHCTHTSLKNVFPKFFHVYHPSAAFQPANSHQVCFR